MVLYTEINLFQWSSILFVLLSLYITKYREDRKLNVYHKRGVNKETKDHYLSICPYTGLSRYSFSTTHLGLYVDQHTFVLVIVKYSHILKVQYTFGVSCD